MQDIYIILMDLKNEKKYESFTTVRLKPASIIYNEASEFSTLSEVTDRL